MKRVGIFLFGALVAVVLMAPVSFGVSAGKVVMTPTVAFAKDPFANGDPVCIAVPIQNGQKQGKCKVGEVEVANSSANGGAIVGYLKQILFVLNIAIAGIIMLVLVIAGVQYILSAGDAARVKAAKSRITHAMTALVLYMFMFAILNALIPGGVL